MSISTFSELKTAIAAWRHRTDLTSVLNDFVALAESKFNRKLRTRQQETDFSGTPTNFEITLPTDFLAFRRVWRTEDSQDLIVRPLDQIRLNQVAGYTTAYALGDVMVTDGSSQLTGVYFAKIPALSDSNTTNWLLTAYPDVYLAAGLAEASFYVKDVEAAAMWTAKADALISEINRTAHKDQFSGPVRVVVR